MTISDKRSKLRLLTAGAMLAISALAVSACSSASDSSSGSGSSESSSADSAGESSTRTVSTENGDIEIPAEPKKVVVLNNALAGYAYHLDLPVAATVPESVGKPGEPGQFWKDDAEKDGTEYLPWSTDGFDLESILATEPDLIIAGGIGFPYRHATQQYKDLSEIAPTIVVPDTLDTWQKQYEFLAGAVGKPEVYQEAVKTYEDKVTEVRDKITPPPAPVAYLMFSGKDKTLVANDEVGYPTTLKEVGLEPAPLKASGKFESYGGSGDALTISSEQITQGLTMPTLFVLGFNKDVTSVDELKNDPVYSNLPAFKDGHAYDLPYWINRPDYDEALGTLDLVEKMFS